MRVRLRHERLAQELSRSRLSLNGWAQRLGFSSGHLSDLVNGKRPFPTAKTREKLIEGLGLSFEELFQIERTTSTTKRSSVNRTATPRGVFQDASRDRPRRRLSSPGGSDVSTLLRDLRYGARALLRSPGFSLAALLTLAIGIGSNTALFSIVDSILWKPYGYSEPERLVVVHATVDRRGIARSSLSFPDAMDIRDGSELLEGLAAWDWEPYNLATDREPQRVGGTRVSAGFFEVLGVPPLMGRTFTAEDDRPGSNAVVILTEGLWRTTFAGDADIVGREVSINDEPATVIGVMPRAAEYPDQTRLWVPLRFDETIAPRGRNFLGTVGRVKPGVSLPTLDAELRSIARRIEVDHPATNDGRGFAAVTLRESLTGDIRTMSVSLLGVVTFVMLIVCANVANLLLSRGMNREREVAIRRAVGASGTRVAQGLLSESVLLALAGGVLGLGLGLAALDQIVRHIEVEIPPWIRIELDHRVLLYTFTVTVVAAALFSLFPVLQALRQELFRSLQQSGNRLGSSIRGKSLRSGIVIAEVALSLVLLVGAGLMLQSVILMSSVETGFERRGALTVGLDLLAHRGKPTQERAAHFHRFLERFESLAGVEAVGATSGFPLMRRSNSVGVTAEGQGPEAMDENPEPQFARVTPDYFDAMGIPLLAGETLSPAGLSDGREAVVSERLAAALWPREDPIGRRLTLGRVDADTEWLTVRGVVGDIVHFGLDRERPPHLYLPYYVTAPARMTVVLRVPDSSEGTGESLAAPVRVAVREIDPKQPLHGVATVSEVVDLSMWQWRFFGSLFWWFGGIALALSIVGIYGVMSYNVTQRRREVGLRMALGADRRKVVSMVLRQGAVLIGAGIVAGLPLAVGLGSVLSSALYEVRPVEPWTLAVVASVLAAVSLAAVVLPARRASRVDPANSLRAG